MSAYMKQVTLREATAEKLRHSDSLFPMGQRERKVLHSRYLQSHSHNVKPDLCLIFPNQIFATD